MSAIFKEYSPGGNVRRAVIVVFNQEGTFSREQIGHLNPIDHVQETGTQDLSTYPIALEGHGILYRGRKFVAERVLRLKPHGTAGN